MTVHAPTNSILLKKSWHHHIVLPVRAQAAERRKREEDIAIQAMELAEADVSAAMKFMRRSMPTKYSTHSSWYDQRQEQKEKWGSSYIVLLGICRPSNILHLQAQREADLRGSPIDKEYVWPMSSPDCTPRLRTYFNGQIAHNIVVCLEEAMNRWIRDHFSRTKRAKCLVIIGRTGTGKTSFVLSLPGRVNYFQDRWILDNWIDCARYSVYDDIPWDDFEKKNYPSKKSLLTQNGRIGVRSTPSHWAFMLHNRPSP